MQAGGGETRDGVKVGLTEETHGAERVAAEERGGGAQGDLSMLLMYLTHSLLRELSERYVLNFFIPSNGKLLLCKMKLSKQKNNIRTDKNSRVFCMLLSM